MSIYDTLSHFIIPIISITYILVYSEIFAPIRRWLEVLRVLDCPICAAFWVGLCVGIANKIYPQIFDTPIREAFWGIAIFFIIELAKGEE